MNVLIVEDEKGLALEVDEFLSHEGFTVEHARTKKSAEEKIFVNNYDFILLDLGLPDGDGFDLLKMLKALEKRDDAVIILTARGAVDDRVMGLEQGADDYLAKPFSLSELLARMHAITRRKHRLESNDINIKGLRVNIQNRTVMYNDERINLTKKEFEIFNYLVLNKNRVISRTNLTEHVWGDVLEINSDSNFVDVHVKNLRKKLSQYIPIDWFETVRSIGYRINI
ncbi:MULTISPECIES: response regulator transcription factor [Mucilaginibacter]|uniref:DNA-binding response OmpR family regulator n=1 Tax=Mucilaginibacter lappiensis TaxID=354630 RepID=A0A1N7B662_9SPHI|nr:MULTISPECIES: response regulator transcription factor [Mucilaginibacter]MBB6110730.1 DNA-binding response OmpR family regulator [Mucilaginibacter lappiensis]MBB6128224.1 DNA-binding response OmpR family regulator [Mucilaginibacter lappiensis]NHA04741.1 response regulator transcription factor [Mucilaginibacter inviolabilis]SIR46776.1 DNA-binding response regulator, OmpR family, contains REC and winged-helix (wHTH) domain [Mucilaginibacter lappiensis]